MKATNRRIVTGMLALVMLLTLVPPGVLAVEPTVEIEAQWQPEPLVETEAGEVAAEMMDEIHAEDVASERRVDEYSIEDIRQLLSDGGQIYQDLRVHSDTTGTITYRVPVPDSEVEYLMDLYSRNIQLFNANPFDVTQIRYSGLSHADSIVVIFLGDAFTAAQYGTWPNPAQGTVLYHAYNAKNAMLATHPFGLFSELFTVYVVHATAPNQVAGYNGYLGTVTAEGHLVSQGAASSIVRQDRIRELADAVVAPQYQTMIQVISNSNITEIAGFAFMTWHYQLHVNIAVTSIRRGANPIGGSNPVWPNGTAWQGTIIHEFGHSFGNLVDEHDEAVGLSGLRANATTAADANVKWRHWAGHRNVLETPTRFSNGWAVPAAVSDIPGQSGCLMRAGWGNRDFCGVCTAELVRRMAFISRETFHGRGPSDNSVPNTPVVTIPQGADRILDSAFHGNTSLQTINISASVDTIGDFAFIGATGLNAIFNYTTTPQQINTSTFAGVNRANVDVMIPLGTTQAYIDAGWGGFNLIETAHTTVTFQANGGIIDGVTTNIVRNVAHGNTIHNAPLSTVHPNGYYFFSGWQEIVGGVPTGSILTAEQLRGITTTTPRTFRAEWGPISSWEQLRTHIARLPWGTHTIMLAQDIDADPISGTTGTAITIPEGIHITLQSNNATMRTLTQTNNGQRHFIVPRNTSLTLGGHITLSGGAANNTN